MGRIKILCQQAMMIVAGVVVATAVEGIIYHILDDDVHFGWTLPISILLAGVLGALPSLFLELLQSTRKKSAAVSIILLHFIFVYLVVITIGYFFGWYSHLDGFIFVTVEYVLIYGFVWLGTIWFMKNDDKKINSVLDEIRDEE